MIFKGLDGTVLFGQSDLVNEPIADVVIVHGLGEHSGRYNVLSEDLQSWGLNVHRFDLRGHGRSSGLRGHVENFSQYHSDIEAFLAALFGQDIIQTSRPLILLGHSLGGLISLGYALRRKEVIGPKLSGLALSAPALGVHSPLASLNYLLVKGLPDLLQTVHIKNGIAPEDLTRDKKIVEQYLADPLVHSWVTPSFYRAFSEELVEIRSEWGKLRVPLLFLLPDADRVVDTNAAKHAAEEIREQASQQVEVKIYKGFYHEIFNELGREQPLLALRKWIRQCCDQKNSKKVKKLSSKSSKKKVIGKAISP